MSNIGLEILIKKLNLSNDSQNQFGSKIDSNQIKKSGVFAGLRSSFTYAYNQPINQVKHFLNKNAKRKISETENLLENNQSSIVYKRNIISRYGTKRSAVPHGIIQNQINRKTPQRPVQGRVPDLLNTKWGQKAINDKYKTAFKLFQNAFQNKK